MNPLPLLKLNPVLARASAAGLARLAKQSEVKLYEKGAPMVLAGSSLRAIYMLAKGKLQIQKRNSEARTELLMGTLSPPALIGDAELYGQSVWPHTMRTTVNSTIVHIPCDAYDGFVASEPSVSYGMYRDSAARHMLSINMVHVIGLQKTANKILRLLATIAEDSPDGGPRRARVSQSTLARSLGVTWKTVSRNLEQLEKEKLLQREGEDFLLTLGKDQTWAELKSGLGAAWRLP